MFYKISIVILFTFTPSFIYGVGLENSYVTIEYVEIDDAGVENIFGTSWGDCGKNNSIYNVFYKRSNNVTGISGGNYVDSEDVVFEMPFQLTLTQLPDRILLRGVIRAFNLKDSKILSGTREIIYQNIEYDKKIELRIKHSEADQEFGINVTLTDKKPVTIANSSPIYLKTSFKNLNGNIISNINSKSVIGREVMFQTSTGKKREDGYFEKAQMQTEILLSNYPKVLDGPFQTELIFRRIYQIDTLYVSEREFTLDVTYTSEYKKEIELLPGKTLLLVFPADTPSVRGFDRVDTLIIRP